MPDQACPRGRAHPVVACYGGADSVGAVQLGETLALALDEPLVIASAYRYEPAALALSARVGPNADNERRHEAAQARALRARRLVGPAVDVRECVVPADGVPEALTELAGEQDASAIVLGRDVHGHVTSSILRHAPCPVAVSPYSVALQADGPPALIGVAYDGSPTARLAAAAAGHLASRTGAEVRLLTVPSARLSEPPARHRFVFDPLDVADRIDADVWQLHGDPAECLIDASKDVDLLFCGSRGRGRALAAVLGSVSAELVRAARCPVIVVPPRVRRRLGAPLGVTTAEELTVLAGR